MKNGVEQKEFINSVPTFQRIIIGTLKDCIYLGSPQICPKLEVYRCSFFLQPSVLPGPCIKELTFLQPSVDPTRSMHKGINFFVRFLILHFYDVQFLNTCIKSF